MRAILVAFTFLIISSLSAFSLKDKLINGAPGDYVVTEQGGTASVLLIRALTPSHLFLEEIDVPSINRKASDGTWKEWIAKEAPGHTAWIIYTIDLKTDELQECYSHLDAVWFPTKDPQHFLPRLLSMPLQKTSPAERKRIGHIPEWGEEDRRSVWNPAVIVEGRKLDQPAIAAWKTRWPKDGSLIADCEVELYFSAQTFPVWIEVKSPHYKASLRAIDSGRGMTSPKPMVFQQSPLILGPGIWKKDQMELLVDCPTYYTTLKICAVDLTDARHPLIELVQSVPLETSQSILKIPQQILDDNLIKGHQYRWTLIPTTFPSMVIYSDQVFQW